MLKEQKELLARVRAAEQSARGLCEQHGLKLNAVVQRLRAAADELEYRIRFIEKQARRAPKPRPPQAPPAPAPEVKPAAHPPQAEKIRKEQQ